MTDLMPNPRPRGHADLESIIYGTAEPGSVERTVADPIARARPGAARAVPRVGELAAVEREAPAANALGESVLEALELGDALVDARAPTARQPRPVAPRRRAVGRQLGELCPDLLERQPDALGE